MTKRQRILVADDDSTVREILAVQLARLDYEVVTADDGTQAVALYEKDRPDLVLLDVLMPVLDGLGACQKIRELEKKSGRRTPVLFLTARDTPQDKTNAILSGGDAFVAKPVSLDELRQHVEAALERRPK